MYETSDVELPNKELMVLEYVMRAVAVPGLNTQQSIEVCESFFNCETRSNVQLF